MGSYAGAALWVVGLSGRGDARHLHHGVVQAADRRSVLMVRCDVRYDDSLRGHPALAVIGQARWPCFFRKAAG